jgi:hypothetical protein
MRNIDIFSRDDIKEMITTKTQKELEDVRSEMMKLRNRLIDLEKSWKVLVGEDRKVGK